MIVNIYKMKRLTLLHLFLKRSSNIIICIAILNPVALMAQTYFNVELDFHGDNYGPYTSRLSELPIYSEDRINKVFDSIVNNYSLETRYPQGGCQQRAQILHYILDNRHHVQHARIWLFAPIDLVEGSSVQLKIQDPNHLTPGDTIQWGYHVAPCLLVRRTSGKLDTVVIDPSLHHSGIMRFKEWLSSITNSEVSKYTFLDSKWYFFNTQNKGISHVINGFFYTYEPINGQKTLFDEAVVERELAINDVAMYLKEKLDKGYPDQNKDIFSLVSNVNNMIAFFASQDRISSIYGPSMRNLLSAHGPLLREAFNYYMQRVGYWLKFTSQ